MHGENWFFIELKSTIPDAFSFIPLNADLYIFSLIITHLQSSVWFMKTSYLGTGYLTSY
jgi:hypothetical protein